MSSYDDSGAVGAGIIIGFILGAVIFLATLYMDYDYQSWNEKYKSYSIVCDNFGGIDSFDMNWTFTCKDGTVIQK